MPAQSIDNVVLITFCGTLYLQSLQCDRISLNCFCICFYKKQSKLSSAGNVSTIKSDMLTNENIEKCHQETPTSPKVKMMFSRTKLIESSLTNFKKQIGKQVRTLNIKKCDNSVDPKKSKKFLTT